MEEIKRRYSFNTGPRFKEQTAPATPLSGFVEVYAKSDGRMYLKDDTGAEVAMSGSVTFPLLAGTGTLANPQYSFAADTDTGMFLNAVGDVRIAASGSVGSFGAAVTIVDDGTNGSTSIFARGTGSVRALIGAFTKMTIINANITTTVPILSPDGTAAAPAYAFANDVDTGVHLPAVGSIALAAGGINRFVANDDGTNGSVTINGGRGSGSLGLQWNGVNKWAYYAGVWSTPDPIWGSNFRYTGATAPGTPAANMVVVYAKTDGKMYFKDSAGLETPMYGGVPTYPLLAPNGSVTAPSYAFTNDVDAGLFLNVAGDIRMTVGGAAKFIGNDDGTNGSAYIDARGTGDIRFRHGGVNKMFVLSDRVSFGGVPASFGEITAPATPPTGEILLYGKTDGRLYSKDDAGVETAVGSVWPQLAPNGSAAAPSYAFSNDPDTGLYLSAVGDGRLVVGGQTRLTATDDGTNGVAWLNGRGTGFSALGYGGFPLMGVNSVGAYTTVPLQFTEVATPTAPASNQALLYPKADGRFYAQDDAGVESPLLGIPHTDVVKVGVLAGNTGSTTFVGLPTALSKSGFVKYRSDTKLLVTVTGSYWTDDAVMSSYIAIDVATVDTVIARHDSIAANTAYSFSIIHDFGTVAAGTLGAYTVQWRVGAAANVATATGYWSLTMTETF